MATPPPGVGTTGPPSSAPVDVLEVDSELL
jgi:hypothetical protein